MMQPEPSIAIQESLRQTGRYTTPPDLDRAMGDRLLGRCDFYLYMRLVGQIVRGAPLAWRRRYDSGWWAHQSAWIMRAMETCGARVDVEGCPSLVHREGPVVYAANHMSMAETMILPCMALAYGDVVFVIKDTLLKYPFLGSILAATKAIAVGRANPRDDFKHVMTAGSTMLENGRSVLIFPQSTRLMTFDPSRFNTMAVKLARKMNVPVVPVALKTDFMGVGEWLRDFGPLDRGKTMRFRFGEPLVVESARATHEQVVTFILDALHEWGGAVVAPAPDSPLTEMEKRDE